MNKYELENIIEIKQIVSIIAIKVALPLYLLFWLLDLIYVPQYKSEFLLLRCLIIPIALLVHFGVQRANTFREAERVALFMTTMCASILNVMIFSIGQGALYSINLHLVAIGGLAFIPWSRNYFIIATLLLYGPYLAIEFSHLDVPGYYIHLAVNTFFIVGVITITSVFRFMRGKKREQEISIRQDLETEINRRKQIEQELIVARDQALAATRAKEGFLANMSHEIRTPLTAIMGYADNALDDDQPKENLVAALKTIHRSSDHLLCLINDILDFSKIEAGELQIEKLQINPLQLVTEVESIVRGLAVNKGLDFRVDYEFPLPDKINSDPIRIKQILLNMCSNAIKFTESGSIRVSVHYDQAGKQLSFQVKDTGIGMTPEQLEKIFNPFKQADSSTSRRFGGTGLGLSLSKKLANLLDGELTVNSEIDKGSVFQFSLRLDKSDDNKLITNTDQITANNNSVNTNDPLQRLKGDILLAEDNIVNQQLIVAYLEKMGANVTCAENGETAIKLAQQHSYDLIYMDMQMPVMAGLEAVYQLRNEGYSAPIVMLTANATVEDKSQCEQAGADDFLTKPIVRQKLYEITARYLKPVEETTSNGKAIYSTLLLDEPEIVHALFAYYDYLKKIHRQIIEAHQNGDQAKFNRILHDLKGTAGSYGYPQLSQLANTIELHHKQQDKSEVTKLLNELNEMCEHIYMGLDEAKAKAG